MTVRELMARLAEMDMDAVVVFPDTYEESEGWGECDPYLTVEGAEMEDGRVVLCGE